MSEVNADRFRRPVPQVDDYCWQNLVRYLPLLRDDPATVINLGFRPAKRSSRGLKQFREVILREIHQYVIEEDDYRSEVKPREKAADALFKDLRSAKKAIRAFLHTWGEVKGELPSLLERKVSKTTDFSDCDILEVIRADNAAYRGAEATAKVMAGACEALEWFEQEFEFDPYEDTSRDPTTNAFITAAWDFWNISMRQRPTLADKSEFLNFMVDVWRALGYAEPREERTDYLGAFLLSRAKALKLKRKITRNM